MIGKCCLDSFDHDGDVTGVYKKLGGLDCYVAGDDQDYNKVIVFITDVFGYKFKNTQLVADSISKRSGIKVIIPDILNDDPLFDFNNLEPWLKNHGPHITDAIVGKFFDQLVDVHHPRKLFAIGFCFGAFFVINRLGKDSVLSAGAIAHPSTQDSELYCGISKPLLINVGTNDVRFVAKQREEVVAILTENQVQFHLNLFTGAPHGFETRGDITIPSIKYAKEKSILDQVYFFKSFD